MRNLMLMSFFLLIGHCAYAEQKDEQIMQDVQQRLQTDGYDTLLAGERELVLLISESDTPLTRGVAVLVGESGQGPTSQHALAPLAQLLNQVGWVTMIMPAPTGAFFNLQEVPSQATPATDEQNPSHAAAAHPAISSQAFTQQEQALMVQMQAVVQRTRQYPGFFLVIAQGTTAAWLTKLYSDKQIDLPDALIAISPFWPLREQNNNLPDLMAKTEMPVLDIYTQWDNPWVLETTPERKIAATKLLKMHYRQRELIGQAMDLEQYQFLSKEIYGWLTNMGW